MMARGCWQVRRQLSAFHDGELPVAEQIAVEAHLRECPACAVQAQELDDLGGWLRTGASSVSAPPRTWEGLPSMVVSRMKAEAAESISGRTGRVFEDLHFVWAALGATGATVACLVLISAIFYFGIASPAGSNQNPTLAWQGMSLPSAPNDSVAAAAPLDEEDLVVLLDAVVTREGRVSKVKLIEDRARRLRPPSSEERQRVLRLLDAMSKARFNPARVSGRVPAAVNMVWLYATLTVKGKMPEVQVMPRPRGTSSITTRPDRHGLVV